MKTHAPRPGTKHRRHRQECMDPKCRETSKLLGLNPKKGTKYCGECNKAYCEDKDFNSRCCFYAHICKDYLRGGNPSPEWEKFYGEWEIARLKWAGPRRDVDSEEVLDVSE